MKKQTILLSFFLLISSHLFAQNIDSLVNRFIKNTGSQELYSEIKNFSLKQVSLDSKIPFESNLLIAPASKNVLRMRTILSRNFIYKLDKDKAEMFVPTGGLNRSSTYQKQNLSDFEKGKLQLDMIEGLWVFLDYQNNGFKASFLGETTVAGKKISQVSFKNNIADIRVHFDSVTGIPVKQEITYTNGEKVEMEFSKFIPNSYGISYPEQTTLKEGPKVTILKNTLEINKLKDSDFAVH